jgi:CopG family nickel-responsive transcriptional regulator
MQMSLIKKPRETTARISISLPDALQSELDNMVLERGYESRSKAISDMLRQSLVEHKRQTSEETLVGTITILYMNSTKGLQEKLAELQYQYLDEVISSLHVNLADKKTMEVMLVQGSAKKVQRIADEMVTLRGVVTGKLQLLAALMPPIPA